MPGQHHAVSDCTLRPVSKLAITCLGVFLQGYSNFQALASGLYFLLSVLVWKCIDLVIYANIRCDFLNQLSLPLSLSLIIDSNPLKTVVTVDAFIKTITNI